MSCPHNFHCGFVYISSLYILLCLCTLQFGEELISPGLLVVSVFLSELSCICQSTTSGASVHLRYSSVFSVCQPDDVLLTAEILFTPSQFFG